MLKKNNILNLKKKKLKDNVFWFGISSRKLEKEEDMNNERRSLGITHNENGLGGNLSKK